MEAVAEPPVDTDRPLALGARNFRAMLETPVPLIASVEVNRLLDELVEAFCALSPSIRRPSPVEPNTPWAHVVGVAVHRYQCHIELTALIQLKGNKAVTESRKKFELIFMPEGLVPYFSVMDGRKTAANDPIFKALLPIVLAHPQWSYLNPEGIPIVIPQ